MTVCAKLTSTARRLKRLIGFSRRRFSLAPPRQYSSRLFIKQGHLLLDLCAKLSLSQSHAFWQSTMLDMLKRMHYACIVLTLINGTFTWSLFGGTKTLTKRSHFVSVFVLFPLLYWLVICVIKPNNSRVVLVEYVARACQPPMQYHSSAAYGSRQYQPDSPQILDLSDQSTLSEELVKNQVNSNGETSPIQTVNEQGPTSQPPMTRPPTNPFVPIEAQPAEKSAHECATKSITSFMDVLDCTSVESYNSDGATARYGSSECGFEPESLCRFYSAPDEELQFRRGVFAHHTFQATNNSQLQVNQFEDSFSSVTKRPLGSVPTMNFLVIAEPFGNTPKANAVLQMDVR